MGLKKIGYRHMDIIRRLLVGQTPGDVCLELGMSESYLSILQSDPIFRARLELEQAKLHERFLEGRENAMIVLEETSSAAAKLCREAVMLGTVGQQEIKPDLRLKSAWDVLDRSGFKAIDKTLTVSTDLADLVAEAYKQKMTKTQNLTPRQLKSSQLSIDNGVKSEPAAESSIIDVGGEEGHASAPEVSPSTFSPPQQLSLFDMEAC